MKLTHDQILGWKANNGAMSPNEFMALCDLAITGLSSARSESGELKRAVSLLTRWHSQGMISTGSVDEMPPSLMKDTVEFVKRNKEHQ